MRAKPPAFQKPTSLCSRVLMVSSGKRTKSTDCPAMAPDWKSNSDQVLSIICSYTAKYSRWDLSVLRSTCSLASWSRVLRWGCCSVADPSVQQVESVGRFHHLTQSVNHFLADCWISFFGFKKNILQSTWIASCIKLVRLQIFFRILNTYKVCNLTCQSVGRLRVAQKRKEMLCGVFTFSFFSLGFLSAVIELLLNCKTNITWFIKVSIFVYVLHDTWLVCKQFIW